jgi:protein-disulfide isomerase
MRFYIKVIFSVLFLYQINNTANAEMTLNELIFDETKSFNLKILDAIPDVGKIQFGEDNAKNTIIEFFDYFCGYCKKIHAELIDLTEKRKDVRVIFLQHPILNESSTVIAKIAIAANMQGLGFDFHHSIFTMQGSITSDKLSESIKSSGVNEIKLKIDMDKDEVKNIIKLSSFLANASGARGTPALFINDEFYGGYLSTAKIEALLK